MITRTSKGLPTALVVSIGIATAIALAGCSAGGTTSDTTVSGKVDKAAAAALPAQFKKAGVINVATDIPFPPMEMYDANQNMTGFDYDLGQALGARLGVKLNFQKQAFDSIIPSLQSGRHDVIMSSMNDTVERQKTLDFVDYFHAGYSLMVPFGNPDKVTSVLDLCGKDVAAQSGTIQAQILHSYDKQCTTEGPGPIKVAELPLETDVQTAVRSGKAVAEIVDSSVAAYSAKTAGDGKLFELVRDPKNPSGYGVAYNGIGVLKKNSGLSKALLLALQAVVADGTYDKILDKYDLKDFAIDKAGLNLGS